MIYALGWFCLVLLSLCASLLGFAWAVKAGQLSDQNRARYLPLLDIGPGEESATPPTRWGRERTAILFILILGGTAMAGVIVLTWNHGF